ncbi:unnamed protein product [Amaranthus hypochondriacus]
MEDPNTTSLPPGCRFYPSEEQLLDYYLPCKNNNPELGLSSSSKPSFYEVIKEINLYDFNPFDLPEVNCFRFGFKGRKRHWYCFTERVNGGESRRRAGFGFWKMKGKVRDVMGNGGKVILGRRKSFNFYLEKFNGKSDVRTDWVMYEYALIDNLKASFVVCRVFAKPRGRNSISEHAFSSCAEESIATVRHIGIQHDGITISALDEGKTLNCDYINGKIAGQPSKPIEDTAPNNLFPRPHISAPECHASMVLPLCP